MALAAPLGAAWVSARRDAYRRIGAPITGAERGRLDPYFRRDLLGRAEVARVPVIHDPLPGFLRGRVVRGMLDLSTVRGMAFIDTIVVAESNLRDRDDEASLLFHELVHIVQYQILGTPGFIRAYLAGWLGAGRSYLDNPLEVMAFELQSRFDDTEVFDVQSEVLGRLRRALTVP